MTNQDPNTMFGLEDTSSQAPSSVFNNDINSTNNSLPDSVTPQANPQLPQTESRTADPSTNSSFSNDESRSYFSTNPNWPFDPSTAADQASGQLFHNPSWAVSQQGVASAPIFPNPMTGGQNPGQITAHGQTRNPNDVLSLPPGSLGNLTPAQQEALRNIAMPSHIQFQSTSTDQPLESPNSLRRGGASSPENDGTRLPTRKRKSSADVDEEEEDDDDGNQPVKKTAHNMIEKRYRTNLNDKIAALRDSVPSLRIMSKSARGEDTTEDREELHGLTPAHKLNKATVLSKATEYIRHLEKRNNRLLDENHAMQQRIAAFEKLFMAGAMNGAISPLQQPPPMQYPPQENQPFMPPPINNQNTTEASPAGMIQVPEDMKRILQAQMNGQPYPVPQQPYNPNPSIVRQQQIQQMQQMQQNRWRNQAPYLGKLMVGSLAGLM